MMTVIDLEKKEKCLKICDKLFENGYIFEVSNHDRQEDYPYINVMTKYGMIKDSELIELFRKNGFECFKSDLVIILYFERGVENLSAEECFSI